MGKSFFIILFLVTTCLNANAQKLGGSCPDLSVTGIKSKDELLRVLNSLKSSAASKDATAMAKNILYPLRVNTKPNKKPVKNETDLKKYFNQIFTEKVLKAIESQKIEDLFCRDQGVMIGDGEVWLNEKNGTIGIRTINP